MVLSKKEGRSLVLWWSESSVGSLALLRSVYPRLASAARALHSSSFTDTNSTLMVVAEQLNLCQVPHHGASLPPKLSGTENCALNSLPSWLQKVPFFFIGFILSECVAPGRSISLFKIFIVACINLTSSLHCVCFYKLLA